MLQVDVIFAIELRNQHINEGWIINYFDKFKLNKLISYNELLEITRSIEMKDY